MQIAAEFCESQASFESESRSGIAKLHALFYSNGPLSRRRHSAHEHYRRPLPENHETSHLAAPTRRANIVDTFHGFSCLCVCTDMGAVPFLSAPLPWTKALYHSLAKSQSERSQITAAAGVLAGTPTKK
jgi:hypothetical protein